jgi:hypothetical protein
MTLYLLALILFQPSYQIDWCGIPVIRYFYQDYCPSVPVPKIERRYTVGDTTVAVMYTFENTNVLVIYNQYETGEIPSGSEQEIKIIQASKELREYQDKVEFRQKKFVIRGHADIQMTNKSFDLEGICTTNLPENIRRRLTSERTLDPISNDCLALVRAFAISKVIRKIYKDERESKMAIDYDPDPFMYNTNKYVKGSLYKVLKLTDHIKQLKNELGITEDGEVIQGKSSAEVQQKILVDKQKYTSMLKNFRSVVVTLEPCQDLRCE